VAPRHVRDAAHDYQGVAHDLGVVRDQGVARDYLGVARSIIPGVVSALRAGAHRA